MGFKKHQFLFEMIFCAIMAAMSIVLDKFLSFPKGNSYLKFTIYGLPLLFTGIMFGSFKGFLTGLVTGIVLQLTSEYGVSIVSPFWALAPVAWGLTSGVISDLCKKELKLFHFIMIVSIASILALLCNTLAMFADIWLMADSYYTAAVIFTQMPPRLISMVILIPFYVIILQILYKALKKKMIDVNNQD